MMPNAKAIVKSLTFILISLVVFSCKKNVDSPQPQEDLTNLVKIEVNSTKPYRVRAAGQTTYLNKDFSQAGAQTLEFRTVEHNFQLMIQTLDGTSAKLDCVIHFEGKQHSSTKNSTFSSYAVNIILRK